ncbi:MAG: swr complex subunit [Bathelium mastoideum]|nr:MAG: swr complex subunit [Bathelium mastoideum]KAI9686570.1 MAG: swr complex subunit [Bathelium mastoideum]
MTSQDVRDMLDLPRDGLAKTAAPKKKQKVTEKKPEGMARELYALLGERAPPVSMIQEQKQYKQRPKRPYRAAKWERTPFLNEARTDNLVLRHWRRQQEAKPLGEGEGVEVQNGEIQPETQYRFAKYDKHVTTPEYDQAQYDAHLANSGWSKNETDYLINLYKEYSGRWAVIADRYEYTPHPTIPSSSAESDAVQPPSIPAERSMEDLKARFYDISAKLMAAQTPLEKMTASEYSTYETLLKFSPERESTRKAIANALLNRNPEEVKEEEWLLQELQRITASQTRFEAERREIRDRLEYPHSARGAGAGAAGAGATGSDFYRTSQALQQLLQTLAQADRTKKRRSLVGADGILASPANGTVGASPASAGAMGSGSAMAGGGRDSLGGAGSAQKKGSSSAGADGSAAAAAAAAAARALSPRAAARYAVSTHERITSGVSFRTDRILKLRQAKSQVQTQRIGDALASLGVPELVVLPTQEVCGEFERLVGAISGLVDLRKVAEKEVGEIKVAKEMRRERFRREGVEVEEEEEEGNGEGEGKKEVEKQVEEGERMDLDGVDEKNVERVAEGDEGSKADQVSEGEEDAEGEVDEEVKLEPKDGVDTKQGVGGAKRSQSVISNASRSSRRSRR